MKRLLTLVLSVAVVALLAHCGSSTKKSNNTPSDEEVTIMLSEIEQGVQTSDLPTSEVPTLKGEVDNETGPSMEETIDEYETDPQVTTADDVYELDTEITVDPADDSADSADDGTEATITVTKGCFVSLRTKSAKVVVVKRDNAHTLTLKFFKMTSALLRIRCVAGIQTDDGAVKVAVAINAAKVEVTAAEITAGTITKPLGMVIVGIVGSRPLKSCSRGRFRAFWKPIDVEGRKLGRLKGAWRNATSKRVGLLKGVLGENKAGEKKFSIAKLSPTGQFEAHILGTYDIVDKNYVLVGHYYNKTQKRIGWVRAIMVPSKRVWRLVGQWASKDCSVGDDYVSGLTDYITQGDASTEFTSEEFKPEALREDAEVVPEVITIPTDSTTIEPTMVKVGVYLFWGRGAYSPLEAPQVWGDTKDPIEISVDAGKFQLKRLFRFEKNDKLVAPRPDGTSAQLESTTSVHHDGVGLIWGLPASTTSMPTLTFKSQLLTQAINPANFMANPGTIFVKRYDVPNSNKKLFVVMHLMRKKTGCNSYLVYGSWAKTLSDGGWYVSFWASLSADNFEGWFTGAYQNGNFVGMVVDPNDDAFLHSTDGTYTPGTGDFGTFDGKYYDAPLNATSKQQLGVLNGLYHRSDAAVLTRGFILGAALSNACLD